MKFRRSFSKVEDGKIRRKAIVLTGIVVFIFILIKSSWDFWSSPPAPHIIEVKMLTRNSFIVDNDTTNYDKFASILKQAVIEAKTKHSKNRIHLSLPVTKQSKDIADIIAIVTAMDLDWKIEN